MIPAFNPLGRRINLHLLNRAYARACRAYSIRDPVAITTFPTVADLFVDLPAQSKIYYCVDDWLEYPGVDRRKWNQMEQLLLDSVDGIAATSRRLLEKFKPVGQKVYLPHGVDYAHFHAGGDLPTAVNSVMAKFPKPVIGFFGLVDSWIDLDLIASLCKRFSQASFVIIGRNEVPVNHLGKIRNLHFLGPVPYAELPSYARGFHVGLIPFEINDLTRAVNPLKILEYFALGLPVLSTRLPEVEAMDGPVFLGSTAEEIAGQLDQILAAPSGNFSSDARSVARQNTWRMRASCLHEFAETL